MNEAAPEPKEIIMQMRVERLRPFYLGTVDVLRERAVEEARLGEIFAKNVWADCTQCGFTLRAADLNELVLADEAAIPPDGKLDRLRKGYCGRRDCTSYFYRMHFLPAEGIHWPEISEKVHRRLNQADEDGAKTEMEAPQPIRVPFEFSWKLKAGLILIVLLILIKWVHWNGSIPVLQSKTTYEVSPKAIPRTLD
jgi:hypothetical protein